MRVRKDPMTPLAAVVAGLHRTALAYCPAMAALVVVAAGSLMLRRRGPATGQGASCDDHKQRRDAGPLSDRVQRGAEGHGHEELSQYRGS